MMLIPQPVQLGPDPQAAYHLILRLFVHLRLEFRVLKEGSARLEALPRLQCWRITVEGSSPARFN